MDIRLIHKQIKDKKLTDRVFFFWGEESGIRDIYVNQIVALCGNRKIVAQSCDDVFNKLAYHSVFEKGGCIVLYNDQVFIKDIKKRKSLLRIVNRSKYRLIFIYDKLDKRSSFYKEFQDSFVEFSFLSPSILSKYILKELPGFSQRYAEELAEICGKSYNRILTECNKIKYYTVAKNYDEAYLLLMKAGVIYKPIGDITFDFVDAILLRNKKLALEYSQKAKEIGESELLTLSVLYSGMRNVLLIQEAGNVQDIGAETRLTSWQIRNAKMKKGRYSSRELLRAMRLVRKVERGVKLGEFDSAIAVDYVIVNIM